MQKDLGYNQYDALSGSVPERSEKIMINGRLHCLRLDSSLIEALNEICFRERVSFSRICHAITELVPSNTLDEAIRSFALDYFQAAATEEGHLLAGHGSDAACEKTFYLH